MKQCTKCKTLKILNDFGRDKTHQDGRTTVCKKCKAKYAKDYRQLHPDNNKNWKKQNQVKVKIHNQRYYKKNKKQLYEINQQWKKAHPNRVKEIRRRNMAKYLSSPKNKLNYKIQCAIRRSLNGSQSKRRWENLVGYTIDELKSHLEKQFIEGMGWNNYGKWHIDHIIPTSHFNFETANDKEFIKCWSLDNLQPLWAFENISKGNQIREFPKRKLRNGV